MLIETPLCFLDFLLLCYSLMAERETSPHINESPLRRRYGSLEMKAIWDPQNLWLKVRNVWIAAAKIQMHAGVVREEEYQDLLLHRDDIDIDVIERREMDPNNPRYVGHDVIAAISEFGDKTPIGKRIIHQGMTSEDALSNAEIMLINESLDLLGGRIVGVLESFAPLIREHKDTVCMGYTHLQAAEPTTVGYRLARYAQDFLVDLHLLRFIKKTIKTKGMKGTVGTSASYTSLFEGTEMGAQEFEQQVMDELGLEAVTISGQTYPRKFTYLTLVVLGSIGQSAHQFAADTKLLQFSDVNQVAEGRDPKDRGSSFMPWKKNPRHSESTKSLARGLSGKVQEAWHSAAEVTLERGLEDSAGKRSYLSDAFIIADEILLRTIKILKGYRVKGRSLKRSLDNYLPFFTLGGLLVELTKRGGDREEIHEIFGEHSLAAQDVVDETGQNPLVQMVSNDQRLFPYMSSDELRNYFVNFQPNVGNAPERCERFLQEELYPTIALAIS